jgi:hypothetical protein
MSATPDRRRTRPAATRTEPSRVPRRNPPGRRPPRRGRTGAGLDAAVTLSTTGVTRACIGGILYLTVLGLFSLAIGGLIRHTAGAIATVIALVLVVPPLISLIPGTIANHIHGYLAASGYSSCIARLAASLRRPKGRGEVRCAGMAHDFRAGKQDLAVHVLPIDSGRFDYAARHLRRS